jgi:rhodanese-related sulfurtransferase
VKTALFLFMTASLLAGEIDTDIQFEGIEAHHGKVMYDVKREFLKECNKVSIEPDVIWGENFASTDVPAACKSTIVRTVGKITPIKIHPHVETYGELEVLDFIRHQAFEPEKYLLADTRGEEWFVQETIPSAIHISFRYIKDPEFDRAAFQNALKQMGVNYGRDGYDFSKAKTLLMFCNGSWCMQSPIAIKKLISWGYPTSKIKWYRGGMHEWKSLNMTTTKSEPGIVID